MKLMRRVDQLVYICVESGVTEGFQGVLTVTVSAEDGDASELQYYVYMCYVYIMHVFIIIHLHWLINLYIIISRV